MTTWHWVRHGPTHQKAFTGWRDVAADLTDTAQLARLHAALPAAAMVVSSDLIRAIATADALAPRLRLPHTKALREFHFGVWDGMSFAAVAARDPALSQAFWDEPGDVAPPGGESWNTLAKRVGGFVAQTNLAYPHGHIIAVAHFGVILTQLQHALGISAHQALAQDIANLSITELQHENGIWQAGRINHIP